MATSTGKVKVAATRGSELLRHVGAVDPRVAEGLNREPREKKDAAPSSQELAQLLEEQTRRAITDPYQSFLYDVRAMHKRGNFKGAQGETILQRIRELGERDEKTLDLSGFAVRDDFALLMIDFLRSKASRITALNVARTQIGVDGATAIARAVNSTLELLQFSENALTIATFRKDAQTTRHAVLSGRAYNHLDAAAIGVLVERESRKLERFDVSKNCLTGKSTNVFHGVAILLNGLKKCPRLRELNISSVDLRAEGVTALADVMVDLGALEKLDLSGNRLCSNSFGDRNLSGFEAFCNALWQVKKLKELSLAQNELDYVACTVLSTMLTVNQRLQRLDLSSNPIAEAGAVQLAGGIKKNAVMEELDMSNCELTCEAIGSLTDALRKFNRTIQVLTLCDNRGIHSNGYKDLVNCLVVNPALRIVNVNPSAKYDHLVARMQDLLSVNSSLVALRRDFKNFDFESLSEAMRTNFVEKLKEMSESELARLYGMHVMEDVEIGPIEGLDAAVSSLRYYSEMQQYTPLKRLLWVLETGSRDEAREKRPKRKDPKVNLKSRRRSSNNGDDRADDEDDDDIWDYPIA